MKTEFYSCGKLLITGEYLILRGARGLALPTSRGQRLEVVPSDTLQTLAWQAKTAEGEEWFKATYTLPQFTLKSSTDEAKSETLEKVFREAQRLNPDFLRTERGYVVDSTLGFPNDWGLGSSSTLVHLIAQWAQVNAFELQQATIGGSGYDVMVAAHECPIIFSRLEGQPLVSEVEFAPSFKEKLWFVHCGHKQNSAKEVTRFDELKVSTRDIDHVSRITDELLAVSDLASFERLLIEHDLLLSRIIGRAPASDEYPSFGGLVKYLGAWGGDFMLAVGEESDMDLFRKRGMNTILSYQDMIKQ